MNDGKTNNDPLTPLAVTNWRDIRRKFGIKQKNRRGHMYVIGKTGTGKSSFLGNMIISDIKNGYGTAIIDPHGDLSHTLLNFIPQNRLKDVIYFDPGDLEYPIAFNPLEKTNPEFHHLVVSGLISVFRKIWSDFWGPRLEHILRNSLFTLLEYPGATLIDIPKLLTDKDFRGKVVASIKHPHVRDFWYLEFEKYSAWLKSEAVLPILNKVSQFLTNLPLRNVVGQHQNTFSIREVMDEAKILIINLSKGKLGEENTSLLGSMIITQIYLAALQRVNIPESERRPFYLYVDEFHSFLTMSFSDILSETRKYGLNLVLAHQYLNQLHEKIRSAILGNVGTIISFRVGTEDSILLAKEFRPVFDEFDLMNLPNYHIYLKLLVNGVTSLPFSATTLPLPSDTISDPSIIIETSKKQYCRLRQEVEKEILFRVNESSHFYKNKQSGLF